jgi:hypothetical protein
MRLRGACTKMLKNEPKKRNKLCYIQNVQDSINIKKIIKKLKTNNTQLCFAKYGMKNCKASCISCEEAHCIMREKLEEMVNYG